MIRALRADEVSQIKKKLRLIKLNSDLYGEQFDTLKTDDRIREVLGGLALIEDILADLIEGE